MDKPGTCRADTSGFDEKLEAARELFDAGGVPLDRYSERQQFDLRRRLALFIQVCETVHHAHQHGVIIGDLNPHKILISSHGVASVAELGIGSRAHVETARDNDDAELVSLTRAGEPVLALEYASPEQVMGDVATTASDIYALGVILYEVMTGRRPYHLKIGSVPEALKAICEQVAEKPSELAIRTPDATKRTGRMLRGDLDSIVLMAMRKEPEARYASAQEFANDIKRHLDRRPVRARDSSVFYQIIKLAQRQVAAAVASLVLIIALATGVLATMTGLIVARHERFRAEESFRRGVRQSMNSLCE